MRFLTALAVLAVGACSPVVIAPPSSTSMTSIVTPTEALALGIARMTPVEAIIKAANASGTDVQGVFAMTVRRAEQVGPRFFLNSEEDYRDQRSLAIAITPSASATLRNQFGHDLRGALLGKNILVYGFARRERIDFTVHGRRTGKYYYQTHVVVYEARQIERR